MKAQNFFVQYLDFLKNTVKPAESESYLDKVVWTKAGETGELVQTTVRPDEYTTVSTHGCFCLLSSY